ncbi:hypothetical protein TNCV_1416001 [Trichonephila clavipes]|nr:hypothetical protein TNCV_1416001 [Trichonephila clavipes]
MWYETPKKIADCQETTKLLHSLWFGKFVIAATFSGNGEIRSAVTMCPKNFTEVSPSTFLEAFRTTPYSAKRWNTCLRWLNPLGGYLPPEKLFRKRFTLIFLFPSKMQQTSILSPF